MRLRLACVVLALSSAACLVDIRHDVADPTAAFRKAREAAARVQGGKGTPHHLNVLVYDAGDRELVSVSAPLWLVRKVGGIALRDENEDDDEGMELARRCLDPANLEKAGLGVLVEVEEDEGDQVLVWLK
jgi:hypothetical protein